MESNNRSSSAPPTISHRLHRALKPLGVVLLAAMAILALACWYIKATMRSNENNVISALRSLSSSQETFRTTALKDQDGDGLGEYGTPEELLGLAPIAGTAKVADPPFLEHPLHSREESLAMMTDPEHPYRYVVYVGLLHLEESSDIIDSQERFYFVTATPNRHGITGRRSFCIDQTGIIRTRDVGGEAPTREALDGAGQWDEVGG